MNISLRLARSSVPGAVLARRSFGFERELLTSINKTLTSIDNSAKEEIKLRRIEFAVKQINLELQDSNFSIWNYHGRDPTEIRIMLLDFRRGYGRWIPNEIATNAYRNSLENEIHFLTGVKPNIVLKEKDGNKQWVIHYS